MAGRQSSLHDPTGDRRERYVAALEFGTNVLLGQLLYARDPRAAFYDRQKKVARASLARAENQIPARSPYRE